MNPHSAVTETTQFALLRGRYLQLREQFALPGHLDGATATPVGESSSPLAYLSPPHPPFAHRRGTSSHAPRIVREGHLSKRSDDFLGRYRRRYFVLFDNHEFCFYNSKPNFPEGLRTVDDTRAKRASNDSRRGGHQRRHSPAAPLPHVKFPARASESAKFPPRGVIDLRDVRSFWRFRGRSQEHAHGLAISTQNDANDEETTHAADFASSSPSPPPLSSASRWSSTSSKSLLSHSFSNHDRHTNLSRHRERGKASPPSSATRGAQSLRRQRSSLAVSDFGTKSSASSRRRLDTTVTAPPMLSPSTQNGRFSPHLDIDDELSPVRRNRKLTFISSSSHYRPPYLHRVSAQSTHSSSQRQTRSSEGRVFWLSAESETELDAWINALKQSIQAIESLEYWQGIPQLEKMDLLRAKGDTHNVRAYLYGADALCNARQRPHHFSAQAGNKASNSKKAHSQVNGSASPEAAATATARRRRREKRRDAEAAAQEKTALENASSSSAESHNFLYKEYDDSLWSSPTLIPSSSTFSHPVEFYASAGVTPLGMSAADFHPLQHAMHAHTHALARARQPSNSQRSHNHARTHTRQSSHSTTASARNQYPPHTARSLSLLAMPSPRRRLPPPESTLTPSPDHTPPPNASLATSPDRDHTPSSGAIPTTSPDRTPPSDTSAMSSRSPNHTISTTPSPDDRTPPLDTSSTTSPDRTPPPESSDMLLPSKNPSDRLASFRSSSSSRSRSDRDKLRRSATIAFSRDRDRDRRSARSSKSSEVQLPPMLPRYEATYAMSDLTSVFQALSIDEAFLPRFHRNQITLTDIPLLSANSFAALLPPVGARARLLNRAKEATAEAERRTKPMPRRLLNDMEATFKYLQIDPRYLQIFWNNDVNPSDIPLLPDEVLDMLLPVEGPRVRLYVHCWSAFDASIQHHGGNSSSHNNDEDPVDNPSNGFSSTSTYMDPLGTVTGGGGIPLGLAGGDHLSLFTPFDDPRFFFPSADSSRAPSPTMNGGGAKRAQESSAWSSLYARFKSAFQVDQSPATSTSREFQLPGACR